MQRQRFWQCVAAWTLAVSAWGGGNAAQAGPIISITVNGTITACNDDGTLTGTAGDSACTDAAVTMVQTIDTGAGPLDTSSPGSSNLLFDAVALSVTVGAFGPFGADSTALGFGAALLDLSTAGAGSLNSQMTLTDGGAVTILSFLDVVGGITTSDPLLLAGNYTPTGATFGAEFFDDGDQVWFFFADVRSIVIDVTGRTLPEPASWAAALLALAMLVALRSRRQRAPARR